MPRLHEAPQRFEIHLKRAGIGHRRLVEHTGCNLQILRSHRIRDFRTRQIAGRDLVGIEPHAHRVVACPEYLNVTHAIDALQNIDQLQGRVVGDIELIARVVR